MKTIRIIVFLLSFMIISGTYANTGANNNAYINDSSSVMDLSDFIKYEYDNFTRENYVASRTSENPYYLLNLVRVGLIGSVALDVAFVAKLDLKPFIYFYFTRKKN